MPMMILLFLKTLGVRPTCIRAATMIKGTRVVMTAIVTMSIPTHLQTIVRIIVRIMGPIMGRITVPTMMTRIVHLV
jgi:hypothetical protein